LNHFRLQWLRGVKATSRESRARSGPECTAIAGEIAGFIKLIDKGALNRGDQLLGIADSV
jgi:hypothetical protein